MPQKKVRKQVGASDYPSGVLSDPMPNDANLVLAMGQGTVTTDAECEAWADTVFTHLQRMQKLREKKFAALFRYFKIATGDWRGLTEALARKHVPGFRQLPKTGRPAQWSSLDRIELYFAVKRIVADGRSTKATALKRLATTDPWESKLAATAGPNSTERSSDALAKQLQRMGAGEKRTIALIEEMHKSQS
jgi:hypothetical protein